MTARPGINHQITFLPTSKLDDTADFYENVLKLDMILDQVSCKIYATAGAGYLGFCQRDTGQIQNGIILTLVTDEVDQWAEYLGNKDIKLDSLPEVNPNYQIYHFFFRDPNGYKIEIQQFLHPFGDNASANLI